MRFAGRFRHIPNRRRSEAENGRRVVHFLNASDGRFDDRSNVVHFLDAK
jgi:hypothetical protein